MRIRTIAHMVWLEAIRRKDVYVLLILLGGLLLALVSLNVFGLSGLVRYVADVGLLGAWLFGWILAVVLGARQLPTEESRGTIFALLAKPVSRAELMIGKWLGAWLAASLALAAFYVLTLAVVWARGGHFDPVTLLQALLLHLALLAVLTALALALSTRWHGDAACAGAFVLSGAAFFVVPQVPMLLPDMGRATGLLLHALYYLMPHLELFDLRRRLVHDWGPAPWDTVALTLFYGALFTAVLLMAAWLAYRNKRFPRSEWQ